MKDMMSEIGDFKPTIAVIRANDRGNIIISSISVRDRLIKACIANSIRKIFVISPEEDAKAPYPEFANENSGTVEYISSSDKAQNCDREATLYINDGFLVHNDFFNDFLKSHARMAKHPTTDNIILSKDNFFDGADISENPNDVIQTEAFDCIEVNEGNREQARSRLFKWLTKKTDGMVSIKLNRPVSTFFSKFFADYPIHPIIFTSLTAIIAAVMTYILITGGEAGLVWGCLLFHIASIADGIDGEIARAKFQSSLRGAKLDTTIDMITNICFMGGMSYALWSTYGAAYLTLGIYVVSLALSGVLLMTALLYFGPGGGRFDILSITIRERFSQKQHLLKIFNFCNYFLKRDAFAFLFAIYGVLGLGKYIPEFLIFGLCIWNLAIILNAKLILNSKPEPSKV